jgi:hypothetical protein
MTLSTAATVAILVMMIFAYGTFAIFYGRNFPWYSTIFGRVLLAQKVTFAIVAGFFLIDTLLPVSGPLRDWTLIGLLVVMLVEACGTLVGLVIVYMKQRDGDR